MVGQDTGQELTEAGQKRYSRLEWGVARECIFVWQYYNSCCVPTCYHEANHINAGD